ncbi:hypothetical protein CEP52_016700 [Fusarium oligoseptatum]|uniref:Uncharacterized protein n=1 Tax=Fusarium oligoseptatum TaxID=2604345 RepID=A0A428S1B5_9HYPO|nr:hypothetical protein CEP52_016700 [Fusarium oligoseptatum]
MASASGVFLAFLSLALFTSVLAATENLEPSALPTLPPANPDMSKDPCAFSDIDKLMYRLENTSLSYNTSLLVETCDDICRLLYGVGNPDILGIGKYGKDEYEDNEWGFGQVMAVIVWVQYVGDLVTILIGMIPYL